MDLREEETYRRLLRAAAVVPRDPVPVDAIQSRVERLRGRRRQMLQVAGATLGVCGVVAAAVVVSAVRHSNRGVTFDDVTAPHPDANHVGRACQASALTWTLTWEATAGGLQGQLSATNTSGQDCDLLVKPRVVPLDAHKVPLDVQTLETLEQVVGPAVLRSGATAVSQLTWAGWCGPPAGRLVRLSLPGGGSVDVQVSGPTTPECPSRGARPTNLISGWFTPLSRPAVASS